VEEPGPLAALEGARHAMVVEERREVGASRRRAIAAPPALGEGGDQGSAPGPVPTQEPLQHGAPLGAEEIVEEGPLAIGARGRRLPIARPAHPRRGGAGRQLPVEVGHGARERPMARRRSQAKMAAMAPGVPPQGSSRSWLRPRRLLVYLMYALLLASAGVTLTCMPALEQAVREGRRPTGVLMVAPSMLALFVALFAAYRFALVRAGRYHAGKAFVQVGLMVLLLSLLLPGSVERYRSAGVARPVDLTRQLSSADAEARALAAELARHRPRPEALRYVRRLLALLDDGSPEVRRQARATLVALAGRDEGGEGGGSSDRWRAYWRGQGVLEPGR
jgi:hypothetical protein